MSSKKRILLISSSAKLGGGAKHIFILKDTLKDEFDFYIAMPFCPFFKENINMDKYVKISERRISLVDIYKLVRFIKRNSIDIIHAHGKGAGLIGRIIKFLVFKPLIYSFHGIHTQCLSRIEKFIYITYEKFSGWIDDEKIFVSLGEMVQANKLNIFKGNNYSIINNCAKKRNKINLNGVKNNLKIGINNKKKNIISICRLVDQKNIFEIFEIAKQLQIYNFIVLGNGYLFDKARIYIKSKNIQNVYLLGNKKDVFKYLYEADLFLSTSLYEGHPISVLEAMSIGLPIVASKVTGNIDTIRHYHSGLFYKLGNIRDAISCIEIIMNNKDLKLNISNNSFLTHRELYTLNKMKKEYISLYKKIGSNYKNKKS